MMTEATRYEPARPPSAATIALNSDVLHVTVLPDKGADIYGIVDCASGIDVLFKSPWGWRDPALMPTDGRNEAGWLDRYAGGWQLLLPNAGPAQVVGGTVRGYHGEAAIVPWTVHERTDNSLSLSVYLTSAPLYLSRRLQVLGGTLLVHTEVTNLSSEPVPVSWVEHPAFGAPFIDERCRLQTGARAFLADAANPGSLLVPGVRSTLREARTVDGHHVDLAVLPGRADKRRIFGALTDFAEAYYSIASPTAGFGLRLDWDRSVHPHAWLWQECHFTPDFPWFGRAFVVAVEPANVLPGAGTSAHPGPTLAPGATQRTTLTLRRLALEDLGTHGE